MENEGKLTLKLLPWPHLGASHKDSAMTAALESLLYCLLPVFSTLNRRGGEKDSQPLESKIASHFLDEFLVAALEAQKDIVSRALGSQVFSWEGFHASFR
jgi:hypothetical protein